MSDKKDPASAFDPGEAIYTPAEVSKYGRNAVLGIKNNAMRGVKLDIPRVKNYFFPVMPGQICGVIAQSSNYKSSFFSFWEHNLAQQLIDEGRDDEIIVHISVEDNIEEMAFLEFGRIMGIPSGRIAQADIQDWDKLDEVANQVVGVPIYRIGESLARPDMVHNLYLSNMFSAVEHLQTKHLDKNPKIAAIFIDYLQGLPYDPTVRRSDIESQRRLQVRQDIYEMRRAANRFNCPVIVAVQAKQHLDGCTPPIMIPGQYDGEESSAIGQKCDRIISLWMPKTTHMVGTTIEIKWTGKSFVVADNMLWLKVAKQRGGLPSGAIFPCVVDFASNRINIDDWTNRDVFGVW